MRPPCLVPEIGQYPLRIAQRERGHPWLKDGRPEPCHCGTREALIAPANHNPAVPLRASKETRTTVAALRLPRCSDNARPLLQCPAASGVASQSYRCAVVGAPLPHVGLLHTNDTRTRDDPSRHQRGEGFPSPVGSFSSCPSFPGPWPKQWSMTFFRTCASGRKNATSSAQCSQPQTVPSAGFAVGPSGLRPHRPRARTHRTVPKVVRAV